MYTYTSSYFSLLLFHLTHTHAHTHTLSLSGVYLKRFQVILEPGDALYIPPYWWHRIETLGESSGTALSLSVVSPSAEEVTLAQALWHPLPFLAFNATEVPTYLPVTLMHAVSGGPADEKQLSTTVKAVAMQVRAKFARSLCLLTAP